MIFPIILLNCLVFNISFFIKIYLLVSCCISLIDAEISLSRSMKRNLAICYTRMIS